MMPRPDVAQLTIDDACRQLLAMPAGVDCLQLNLVTDGARDVLIVVARGRSADLIRHALEAGRDVMGRADFDPED